MIEPKALGRAHPMESAQAAAKDQFCASRLKPYSQAPHAPQRPPRRCVRQTGRRSNPSFPQGHYPLRPIQECRWRVMQAISGHSSPGMLPLGCARNEKLATARSVAAGAEKRHVDLRNLFKYFPRIASIVFARRPAEASPFCTNSVPHLSPCMR